MSASPNRTRLPLSRMLAIAVMILSAPILVGCSATEVLQTWRSPDFTGPAFRKVLVVGVGFRPAVRWACEDALVRELANAGAQGVASHTLFDDSGTRDKATILRAAAASGADAVLMTQFALSYKEPTYLPPSPEHDVDDPWPQAQAPVVGQNQVVILRTLIYNAKGAQLIWSGNTKTYDAARLEHAMESLSETIAKELLKEKIVGPAISGAS